MIRPGFTLLFLLKKKPWEKYLFPQLLNSPLCSCGWSNLFSSLMGFLTGSIQIGCSMFLTHSKWKDNIRARLYLSGVWVAQEVDASHSICSFSWRHFCVHYGKKKRSKTSSRPVLFRFIESCPHWHWDSLASCNIWGLIKKAKCQKQNVLNKASLHG